MLCHFLLPSQDFVQQLSRNLWLLRWRHRNHLANPLTPLTHISACKLLTWLLHPAVQGEGWEGRADAGALKMLYLGGAWSPRACQKQIKSLMEKGPSHSAQPSVFCKYLNTVTKGILEPALHVAGCVLALDADQLCTLQAEGFLALLCLSQPLTHQRINVAFTAINILLPWADINPSKWHIGSICTDNYLMGIYFHLYPSQLLWQIHKIIWRHAVYEFRSFVCPQPTSEHLSWSKEAGRFGSNQSHQGFKRNKLSSRSSLKIWQRFRMEQFEMCKNAEVYEK